MSRSISTRDRRSRPAGITLVEMLIGMAITLVMMAAVVTIFANVSSSVQRRRATIEMSGQLRHVRNVLQRDLAGATCPTLPWQRPESNRGYFEIVEGLYSDQYPSIYTDGDPDSEQNRSNDGLAEDELDPETSIIPRGNNGDLTSPVPAPNGTSPIDDPNILWAATNGLGDHDDILALTVRNENEPFVGRVPSNIRDDGNPETRVKPFPAWSFETIESPVAEVVWFAVENPMHDTQGFFGEPGMRTIYRRVLLVAPWLHPYRMNHPQSGAPIDTYRDGDTIRVQPGVVRVLGDDIGKDDRQLALAALVAFQETYDLSVRLEWNPRLGDEGRYQIVANTLGDLTKRENRYEHHFYAPDDTQGRFPFAMVSEGTGYSGDRVRFVQDPEWTALRRRGNADARANLAGNGSVISYRMEDPFNPGRFSNPYSVRPFAYVDAPSGSPATVRAMLNDQGVVVHAFRGLVPLWGQRRGEDVMLTDALAFDVRVFDPGAPIYQDWNPQTQQGTETVLEPADAGWGAFALQDQDPSASNQAHPVGAGAYVDLGYWKAYSDMGIRRGYWSLPSSLSMPAIPLAGPLDQPKLYGLPQPLFFGEMSFKSQLNGSLANGVDAYRVYDTWSFHYEHDGINQDGDTDVNGDPLIDEGTNGLDDPDPTLGGDPLAVDHVDDIAMLGVDDVNERETAPPYDHPLRGVQVKLRLYERDSRQIREVSVNQHFVPE